VIFASGDKFAYGGSIISSSQFFELDAVKNGAISKVVKIDSKIIISLSPSKSVKLTLK
jgi:hypothetical protein